MKSKVSFKFDGIHNKNAIIKILKNNLTNVKTSTNILDGANNTYRLFVYAEDDVQKIIKECKAIQNTVFHDISQDVY